MSNVSHITHTNFETDPGKMKHAKFALKRSWLENSVEVGRWWCCKPHTDGKEGKMQRELEREEKRYIETNITDILTVNSCPSAFTISLSEMCLWLLAMNSYPYKSVTVA